MKKALTVEDVLTWLKSNYKENEYQHYDAEEFMSYCLENSVFHVDELSKNVHDDWVVDKF